jgi:hypothetical protein
MAKLINLEDVGSDIAAAEPAAPINVQAATHFPAELMKNPK